MFPTFRNAICLAAMVAATSLSSGSLSFARGPMHQHTMSHRQVNAHFGGSHYGRSRSHYGNGNGYHRWSHVRYRRSPSESWNNYGSYGSEAADYYRNYLQQNGYEAYTWPRR